MIPSVRAIGGADTTKFEPLFADARWANLVFDATEVSGSKTYTVPTSLPFCRGKPAVVHWWVHGATCDTFRWCVAHTPALGSLLESSPEWNGFPLRTSYFTPAAGRVAI